MRTWVSFCCDDGDVNGAMYKAVLDTLRDRFEEPSAQPVGEPFYKSTRILKKEQSIAAQTRASTDRRRRLKHSESATKAKRSKHGITGTKREKQRSQFYLTSTLLNIRAWIDEKEALRKILLQTVKEWKEYLLVTGGSHYLKDTCARLKLQSLQSRQTRSQQHYMSVWALREYDRNHRQYGEFLLDTMWSDSFILMHDDIRESLTSWLKRSKTVNITTIQTEITEFLTNSLGDQGIKIIGAHNLSIPVSRHTAHRWAIHCGAEFKPLLQGNIVFRVTN